MRVVAIVNQKGGCGKTTTAVNLAAVMARDGVRTLLVDMDPQSHCAAGLGVPDQRIERTIADAMLSEQPHRQAFGLVAGALIGTVGVAAEWVWAQVWMPIPWPAQVLPTAIAVSRACSPRGGMTSIGA